MTAPNTSVYASTLKEFVATARQHADARILDLFRDEPRRLETLSLEVDGLYLDISRQRMPLAALTVMGRLVQSSGLADQREAMFNGEAINFTEHRAVFHVALRAPAGTACKLGANGEPVDGEIQQTLDRMRSFSREVRNGKWRGASGEKLTDVVNVGIGGSQLGPLLACDALQDISEPAMRVHFLANIDPVSWQRIRRRINPATTLIIIASKSWRTIETARNAQAVRSWLLDSGIAEDQLHHHLVGVTANPEGAREFGLSDDGIFPFRDWVGGRYSLWSAIGLPVMLQIGPDGFDEMLAGAHAVDQHFLHTPWDRNGPVLLALLSLWNAVGLRTQTEAVIPYTAALARLPAYLQQLQMESNGKSVDRDGARLTVPSSPVVWGEPGTDAQHSFFQALHQGPQPQPVDFILVAQTENDPQGRGLGLHANALAQAEALLQGQASPDDPHRRYDGNRPSTTVLLPTLSARHFGALIALYEHKTASLGWLLRINSFDQWGVELGKVIASKHEALLKGEADADAASLDPSTLALLRRLQAAHKTG